MHGKVLMLLMLGWVCALPFPVLAEEVHHLQWDGQERSYRMEIPARQSAVPLVILLHGGSQSSREVWKQTHLPEMAQDEGFVLVAPDGIGKHWNDGRTKMQDNRPASTADDTGFILAIADRLQQQGIVDAHRVYVAGASNGGVMALRLACEHPDRFAAVAAVIATMPEALTRHCHTRPIPVQFMLGTEDPMMPWKGGSVAHGKETDPMLSAPDTVEWWAAHNHCSSFISSELPNHDGNDGSTVTRMEYMHCDEHGKVLFYRINGGGHMWPQIGVKSRPLIRAIAERLFGNQNRDIDAGEVIWDFFKRN